MNQEDKLTLCALGVLVVFVLFAIYSLPDWAGVAAIPVAISIFAFVWQYGIKNMASKSE